ncbi:YhbY family RNA-binding protein [Rubrivirga sp. IMCC43871]|uniref:YhbY family RNA-binding protein n=1 Tax=Rubrivirga sp. IMCC43871 TaxID=3391575 RepID=UPI00398FE9D1
MSDLSSKQRANLRKLAQSLKPTVHVGKEGVTEAALQGLRQTFATHEVVKVRVLEAAPESAKDTAYALVAGVDEAEVVQVVGRNATLFRPMPDPPPAPPPPTPDPKARRTPPRSTPKRGTSNRRSSTRGKGRK